jgi:hypothetical protein
MNYSTYSGKIDAADMLSPNQRSTFLGTIQTVLLPKDFVLWRFKSKHSDNAFGAYWMESETMASIMQSLHKIGNYSQEYKKENIRNNLAILEKWSFLNWRVKIRLTKETIAYTGQVADQDLWVEEKCPQYDSGNSKVTKLNEIRRGSAVQIVVPRFWHITESNEWAQIEYCQHI